MCVGSKLKASTTTTATLIIIHINTMIVTGMITTDTAMLITISTMEKLRTRAW